MTLLVFLAGLASAVLHAAWNAATRHRAEPGDAFASVVIMAGVICIPVQVLVGLPNAESLVWLGVGALFNVATMRLIMATYRLTPFAVGYPIVRGTSPLAVALLGLAIFGESLSLFGALGIGAISAGVFLLGLSTRGTGQASPRGMLLAVTAGIANACFVLADARGVRVAGDVWQYGLLVATVNAVLLAILIAFEKTDVLALMRRTWRFSLLAATASMGSYLFILYAFTHGPTGPVSALRETSVFFGILFAATLLREPVGPLRWFAAGLALAGIVMIRLS